VRVKNLMTQFPVHIQITERQSTHVEGHQEHSETGAGPSEQADSPSSALDVKPDKLTIPPGESADVRISMRHLFLRVIS